MKFRLALAALVLAAVPALAESPPNQKIDPAKETDIRHLLDLMGSRKLAEQMVNTAIDQLQASFRKALPPGERSQKIMETLFQKFQAKFKPEQLVDLNIPIFDKYFSAEDIKGLIQFYESPLGQRTVKALPQATRESYQVGSELGQKLMEEVLKEMQEEYPELRPPEKPAPNNQ